MNPATFNHLHALRMANDETGYRMDDMRPRFVQLAARHENGTAPRAVSAFQLFQTPPALAARLVAALNPTRSDRVLEPSAGLGRILDAIAKTPAWDVTAVEIAANLAGELYRQERPEVRIVQRDFLACTVADLGTFDAIAMNPPFHMRADIQHILHALTFLKPGGKLAALCMDTRHRAEALRPLAHSWEVIPAGTFNKEGTSVGTVLATFWQGKQGAA
jgi:predicted RNA methylase